MVEEKKFREDLFYRLNVIRLELPPLKERRGDIPLLIDHLLKKLRVIKQARAKGISEAAMSILLNYDYPGNIRELENILEHALIICQDEVIEPRHLPIFLQRGLTPISAPAESALDLSTTRRENEKQRIYETLQRYNWNRNKAAQELSIDRSTLWRKMKKYNLSR